MSGAEETEFYTLTPEFIKKHHNAKSTWQKVMLKKLQKEIEPFKNEQGIELIAKELGVPKPQKLRVEQFATLEAKIHASEQYEPENI